MAFESDFAAEARRITTDIYTKYPVARPLSVDNPEAILADPDRVREIARVVHRRLFNSGHEVQLLVEDLFDVARLQGLISALQMARDWLEHRTDLPQARILRALDLFVVHHPLAIESHLAAPPLFLQSRFTRGNACDSLNKLDSDWVPPVLPSEMSLAYWREDYHRNAAHFKWHVVFFHGGIPDPADPRSGSRRLTMNRQGESFLYMHQQMMARYEAERLSWCLSETIPFSDYDEIIVDGYDPPAQMVASNPHWPFPYLARPAHRGLVAEIAGYDGVDTTRDNLKRIEAHVVQCIDEGKIVGTDIPLTEHLLGCLLEVNVEGRCHSTQRFGIEGLHNGIHDNFSLIGRGEHTTNYGVMGTTQDSSRDPIFYRVHRHLDDIRHRFAEKQSPHDLRAYAPEGISIVSFRLESQGSTMQTFLGPSQFLYERGKLEHAPFAWHVELDASETTTVDRVTARIFICPKEKCDDRRAWIEMDKFSIAITPGQSTTVNRADRESSVARKEDEALSSERESRFCDCGWPQNLMMPAGTPEGMDFVACLVLTTRDVVERKCRRCRSGDEISSCGSLLGNTKYPDALGMGYPFHRRFTSDGPISNVLEQHSHVALHSFKITRQVMSSLVQMAVKS